MQFARFLKTEYTKKGITNPRIFADSWVSLNGRRSRPYLRPDVDLALLEDGWAPKNWILPLEEIPYRAER